MLDSLVDTPQDNTPQSNTLQGNTLQRNTLQGNTLQNHISEGNTIYRVTELLGNTLLQILK